MIGDRLRADEGDSRNMTRTPLARHATAIAVVLLTSSPRGRSSDLSARLDHRWSSSSLRWRSVPGREGRGSWPPH